MNGHPEKVSFIWSVADLLRGSYKASDYGKVVLPFVVLRRLDCLLEPTKPAVLAQLAKLPASADPEMREKLLNRAAGHRFHNASSYTFDLLKADPAGIEANLRVYVAGFSDSIRDIFIKRFEVLTQVGRLDAANLLYLIVSKFAEIDLHPDKVSNLAMGYVFEELIRRFAEQSNETAGEHFTPREVIRLMVNLLLCEDSAALTEPGAIRTIYDPACGTGGMLSVAEEYLRELNPSAKLVAFGQELNPESFAVCKSDLIIKGQDSGGIAFGNSFSEDGHPGERFDYCISNPPFGVEWKNVEREVADEHKKGAAGRFGAGLPRVSDGSLLFVQHMISKFHKDGRPSRLAVVLNGSPLFTGGAGSGESEIRRWVIENDWLEAIIGLPDQLFYNTGISTYVWIITSRKAEHRRGRVQLIDATGMSEKMRRSLGNKRNLVPEDAIKRITRLFGDMAETEASKVFRNEDFGYQRITVERPLRKRYEITQERAVKILRSDLVLSPPSIRNPQTALNVINEVTLEDIQLRLSAAFKAVGVGRVWMSQAEFGKAIRAAINEQDLKLLPVVVSWIIESFGGKSPEAEPCCKGKKIEPDPDLRDTEAVPLTEDIQAYFEREVLPHAPDAWIDHDKTRRGYEIPFTRHFYRFAPPRPLAEIDADLRRLSAEIQEMLREIAA